jgi:hypothetical protein
VCRQVFPRLVGQLPLFPIFCGTPLLTVLTGRLRKYCGVGEMNEVTELATAGLVVVFSRRFAGRFAPFHWIPVCEAACQALTRS